MKKLRITVNSKVYDVTVQVLEDDERVAGENFLSPLPSLGAPAPVVAAAPASPAPSPSHPMHPNGTPIKGDPNAILAPLAGIVQKIFVQVGSHVDAKAPVVMLDAMKMDTYIYAPRAGDIEEVSVTQGASVQVGDHLIRYKPEA